MLFFTFVLFFINIPARAQAKEKPSNIVNAAELLARLNSQKTSSLFQRDFAETNLSRETIPPKIDPASVAVSRDEGAPNVTQSPPDSPKFLLVPYIWFSGFKGDIGVNDNIVSVDAGFSEIIGQLNFGVLMAFDAKLSNRWRLFSNFIYMSLSDDKATPGPLFDGAQIVSKTFVLDPEFGYRIVGGERVSLDTMVGLRYWHLNNQLELRRGASRLRVSGSRNWVDMVGGLRVSTAISRKAFIIAKGDIGGLGSDFSYQLFGGLGFNLGRHIVTTFGYRHLAVDYRSSEFIFDTALSGFLGGFGFRF